jgi:hypothetical protein
MINLALVTIAVFLLNLPFGYWRGKVKKFSLQWFLAVHLPVPFVIALRILGGLGFQWYTYPFLVGAFFVGQYAGARYVKLKMEGQKYES